MFGSVKSQKSDNQSIDFPNPAPIRESVTSAVPGNKKEDVNFSMFDSIQKSQLNDN